MFGLTRWSPFEDMFSFQREVDRLFNQFWSDLPARATTPGSPIQVNTSDDDWHIDVLLPGVDPQHIALEVSGNTLVVRAAQPDDKDGESARFEQSVTMPQFLDLDKLQATHRHGMLRLTVPVKESVKPRRIQIEGVTGVDKQLTGVA
jgi:HSP20 family protein